MRYELQRNTVRLIYKFVTVKDMSSDFSRTIKYLVQRIVYMWDIQGKSYGTTYISENWLKCLLFGTLSTLKKS